MDSGNSAVAGVSEDFRNEYSDVQLRELNDLQLAFVGGGIGETAI